MALSAARSDEAGLLSGFTSIEAVRSNFDAKEPPEGPWTPVTLPDDWTARWPGFDGVVWYRLNFEADDAAQTRGLAIDYWTFAGAVWLNGVEIGHDTSLVEPLTRSWNVPRYFLLPAPLLHNGVNTLLVRVSGLAAYQPGLGPAIITDEATASSHYERVFWWRQDLVIFNLGVSATLAAFFLAVWLLRRREATYGWFSAMMMAWFMYSLNFVSRSPWPFSATDDWQRLNMVMFMLTCQCFTMFVIRFAERRLPRTERAGWAILAASICGLLLVPNGSIGPVLGGLALAWTLLYLMSCALWIGLTWQSLRVDFRFFRVVNLVWIVASVHDILAYLGVLKDNFYYTQLTSQFQMAAVALVLAWHFVASLRRIEAFNQELEIRVEDAKEELALSLGQQHAAMLANTRLAERINLAHNLHDGMGSRLVTSIAILEHAPQNLPADRFLAVLKELRDELRMIIDTSSGDPNTHQGLVEWIAPVRSRYSQVCESRDIECRWNVDMPEQLRLPSASSVDIVRILQEAITNVLKHSQAGHVEITLRHGTDGLVLSVEDDGVGFEPTSQNHLFGTGLRSINARAKRLSGETSITSHPGRTELFLRIPAHSLQRLASEATPARI